MATSRVETGHTQIEVVTAFNLLFPEYQREFRPLLDKLLAGKRLDYYREQIPAVKYYFTVEGLKLITGRDLEEGGPALAVNLARYTWINSFEGYSQEEGIPIEGMLEYGTARPPVTNEGQQALEIIRAASIPYYWRHPKMFSAQSNARVRQEALWLHQTPFRDSSLGPGERNGGYWNHAEEDWMMAEGDVGRRRELIVPST